MRPIRVSYHFDGPADFIGFIDVWVDDHSIQLTGCLPPDESASASADNDEETLFSANWSAPSELQSALDGLADWVRATASAATARRFSQRRQAYPWYASTFPIRAD